MNTIITRAAVTAAVFAAASAASLTSASAADPGFTCRSIPVGGQSVNYGGKLNLCENLDQKQTRIYGTVTGMSKKGGHVTVRLGAVKVVAAVCGVEDKTLDTGWQPGIGNWIIQQADGGCPFK
ncbi:hypothetical protein [Streptomyces atratus]|uniref:hypothetical protein n=1 Tax=Streptomyces atratus TaxID=1893 RepID=UPI0037A8FB30